MTLDALDRAFDDGVIDARAPVLPPGASAWTTLGEAAGLEPEPPPQHDMPSLSPMAISAPSSPPPAFDLRSESPLDLDLPDTFDELKPRRRGLLFGGVAAGAAAAVMVAVVLARIGSGMPTTTDIKATAAIQAPPAAVETLPAAKEAEAPKPAAGKPELSDWQKRMLLDGDKAREEKTRAKNQEKADKNVRTAPRKQQPKASGGLLNGGDRFDPLNGAL